MEKWTEDHRPSANDMKNLIGKHVEATLKGWSVMYVGVVLEVVGKNILIEVQGTPEWYWFGSDSFSFNYIKPRPDLDHDAI